jgi:hypothetical protein
MRRISPDEAIIKDVGTSPQGVSIRNFLTDEPVFSKSLTNWFIPVPQRTAIRFTWRAGR